RKHALLGSQEFGDDSGDMAARFQHGFGNLSHEPQAAPAIDQANPGFNHGNPKVSGRRHINGAFAGTGAAINTEISGWFYQNSSPLLDGCSKPLLIRHIRLNNVSDSYYLIAYSPQLRL